MRLAEENPAYCAGCYGQYPDRRHVDLEAAYDGPVLNSQEIIGTTAEAQTIDDLVLCEECVKHAAVLVGYGDVAAVDERVGQLEADLADARRNEQRALNYADGLEESIGNRPVPLATRRGRPRTRPQAA